ncbi:MAG: AAC(3) family N-acetyltransferase, partial [Phycisphaerales bacterium]
MSLRELLQRVRPPHSDHTSGGAVFRSSHLSGAAIVRGLRALGIREGDDVMFECAPSFWARVDAGPDAVIDAVLEAVGPEGTVLTTSFSEPTLRRGAYGSWWDVSAAPADSALADAFWHRGGAMRSNHPTHAVAAIGGRAKYFTSEHGPVGDRYGHWGTGAFSSRSPWEKVVAEDVHYVLMGIGTCTLGHHVEGYLVTEHITGLPEEEERGFAAGLLHEYYNNCGVWPNAATKLLEAFLKRYEPGAPAGRAVEPQDVPPLERPRRPDRVALGRTVCWRFSAAEYFQWCVDQCRKAPATWMDEEYLTWKQRIDQRLGVLRALEAGEEPPQTLLSPTYKRDWDYWVGRIKRDRRLRRWRRKIFKPPRVTKEDIIRGLKEVGLKEGDEVMFHSSLYALGEVEGGADAVIDAYLETVGRDGTVMVPSYAEYKQRTGGYGSWWDPKTTPVYTGRITEVFWRRPEAMRSNHPAHAIAAIGRRAEYFTSGHGTEGDRYGQWDTGEFASWSPWEKMVEEDINYMLIGIVRACTLGYHAMARVVTEHLRGLPEAEAKGLATCLLNLYYNRRGVSPRVPTRLRAAYLKRW